MRTTRYVAGVALVLAATTLTASAGEISKTTFSYAGYLERGGEPINALCNVEIDLWNAEFGGEQIGDTAQFLFFEINNGYFTVDLDFGDAFNGARRWLEIRVQCDASGIHTLLPRQEITPAPNALWSNRAPQQIAPGIIVVWSGTLADIPEGWALCDGSNGTPDMRDRFVLGVGDAEAPGATGGTDGHQHSVPHEHDVDPANATLSAAAGHTHETPAHDHVMDPLSLGSSSDGNHNHTFDPPAGNTNNDGGHTHAFNPANVSSNSTGAHSNHSIGSTGGSFGWAGVHVDDDAVRSHSHNDSSSGSHSHTIDFPSTNSASATHSHSVNVAASTSTTNGNHTHSIDLDPTTSGIASVTTSMSSSHQHSVNVPSFSSNEASPETGISDHQPPFYEVGFLMKLVDPFPAASAAPTRSGDSQSTRASVSLEWHDRGVTSAGDAMLTNSFVYQGTLTRGESNISTTCDMIFEAWNAASEGDLVGGPLMHAVEVRNGGFSTTLDFGEGVVNGGDVWLALSVECPGDGGATAFEQRVPLHVTPTALFARSSPKQMPSGAILMWSGALNDVPAGWLVCDGTQGTPDMRDRFLKGAPADADPGTRGGALSHSHTLAAHSHTIDPPATVSTSAGDHLHTTPAHVHSFNPVSQATSTDGSHLHNVDPGNVSFGGGEHSHSVDLPSTNTSSNGNHSHTLGQTCGDRGAVGFGQNDGVPTCHAHSTGNSGNHSHSFNPGAIITSAGSSSAHSHDVNIGSHGSGSSVNHSHNLNIGPTDSASATMDMQTEGIHAHALDVTPFSSTEADADVPEGGNLPPYYKLAFIMKE